MNNEEYIKQLEDKILSMKNDIYKELSERMKSAGMIPLGDTTKPNSLSIFIRHAAMKDLEFYEEYLSRKCKEYATMQASHQLGIHALEDSMFDYVLGKNSAYKDCLENFRAASETK